MNQPDAAAMPERFSNSPTHLIRLAFVLTGVMTTLLGPMLPVLSARWALSDAQAGYLFTAQFTGSILGTALSGVLVQRRGYRITFVAGLVVIALGAAALLHTAWAGGMAAVFGYGVGLGLAIPTGNLLIAEWNPERRAAALNWLNLCWGIGAAGCPFAVAEAIVYRRTDSFLLVVAATCAVVGLILAVTHVVWPEVPQRVPSAAVSGVWGTPFVLVFGSLFFLYVGTENSVGGWISSYTQRLQSAPGARWALAPSLFWSALLAGRAFAPGVLKLIAERELARLGLLLAAGGLAVLLFAHNFGGLLAGVAITGLGLSAVFPITISLMTLRFGKLAPQIGGVMFALAGLGGATLPRVVGVLSTRFGGLRTGLYVPLLGCLAMQVLYFFAGRSTARTLQTEPGP